MPRTSRKLINELRAALAAAGDPVRAARQQRYMKSDMPYRGILTPRLRVIYRDVFGRHVITREADWEATVRALWDEARFREERYAAVAMLGLPAYRWWQTMDRLPLYDHLIVSGAWWDYIDSIAPYRLGHLLTVARADIEPVLRNWAGDDNVWRRRSAILSQLTKKADTDTRLLRHCLRASFGHDAFFVNKAMGWALRNYSYHNPQWVIDFVERHAASLAPLTRREALKVLQKRGRVELVPRG